PKFGGRLTLAHMKKNSGSGGPPRNKGLRFSRGEYIFFLDSDDLITPTALEELYTQAKNFDADVVHCEKFYFVPENFINTAEVGKNLQPSNYLTWQNILVKEPLVWENNFEERLRFFNQKKLVWNVWLQLVRRDFIMNSGIQFCNIFGEDLMFTMCELCCANKYVIVPNVIYYYRQREGSVVYSGKEIPKRLKVKIKALTEGIRYLDKFLSDSNFFSSRPDLKYLLFDFFAQEMLGDLAEIYAKVPAYALDEILRKEFGDDTAFLPVIFSTMNIYRLQLIQAQQQFVKFNQFAERAQKQIAQLEAELAKRN
ncbi:MAG: glycosyltransferase, partial [Selenomonadaceae bacterium]|nr:glycosyltransferase [Selenomonadaceae bacterium]